MYFVECPGDVNLTLISFVTIKSTLGEVKHLQLASPYERYNATYITVPLNCTCGVCRVSVSCEWHAAVVAVMNANSCLLVRLVCHHHKVLDDFWMSSIGLSVCSNHAVIWSLTYPPPDWFFLKCLTGFWPGRGSTKKPSK